MTPDGYPDDTDCLMIENWYYGDLFGLFNYMKLRWAYADWGWSEKWVKDDFSHTVLKLNISTAGWSGNEKLISAFMGNRMARSLTHESWRRGGHYEFTINPIHMGYKPASEWIKQLKISRQAFYKRKDFHKLDIGNKILLFKQTQTNAPINQ